MSHARVFGTIGVAALAAAIAAVAYAQTTVTPIPETPPVDTAPLVLTPETTTWGDAGAGANKAGTCVACHGLDGNPTDPQYPRLAGQSERYIAQQIALFKSGERDSGMAAIMKPFADMLSAQDARDIGAYYATQQAGAGVADDALIAAGPYEGMQYYEVGEKLYLAGDAERGIPACLACHGPDGTGNPGPAYPHVAGQFAEYSQRRLQEYRAGATDRTDPASFNVMASVAAPLTDEEIGALASYLQGLHPRAHDLAAANAPTPAVAPRASTVPAQTDAAPAGAAAEQPTAEDETDATGDDAAAPGPGS
ncbi:c-type cytochrome [Lysobacter sp. D1-1-M9]|uniref:c-type cytochrome n=2 Tax=Novilysobacter TaxID=3382699 RepID=UPI002FCC1437